MRVRAFSIARTAVCAASLFVAACSSSPGPGGNGGGVMGTGGGTGTGGGVGGGTVAGSGGHIGAGGATGRGGATGTGGVPGSGGLASTGGAGTGGATSNPCEAPGLAWKSGAKTMYESYPAPGSVECVQYSGCLYQGQFAACNVTETKDWVAAHNIVSVFPDFATLKLHDLCLKSGPNTIVVTVLDTCGDSDCGGCCTANRGSADDLVDIESFTNARWGVPDGRIQWADLGPTTGTGCN